MTRPRQAKPAFTETELVDAAVEAVVLAVQAAKAAGLTRFQVEDVIGALWRFEPTKNATSKE